MPSHGAMPSHGDMPSHGARYASDDEPCGICLAMGLGMPVMTSHAGYAFSHGARYASQHRFTLGALVTRTAHINKHAHSTQRQTRTHNTHTWHAQLRHRPRLKLRREDGLCRAGPGPQGLPVLRHAPAHHKHFAGSCGAAACGLAAAAVAGQAAAGADLQGSEGQKCEEQGSRFAGSKEAYVWGAEGEEVKGWCMRCWAQRSRRQMHMQKCERKSMHTIT